MYSHFFIHPKLWLFSCNELYTPGVKKGQGSQKDTTTIMMLDFYIVGVPCTWQSTQHQLSSVYCLHLFLCSKYSADVMMVSARAPEREWRDKGKWGVVLEGRECPAATVTCCFAHGWFQKLASGTMAKAYNINITVSTHSYQPESPGLPGRVQHTRQESLAHSPAWVVRSAWSGGCCRWGIPEWPGTGQTPLQTCPPASSLLACGATASEEQITLKI